MLEVMDNFFVIAALCFGLVAQFCYKGKYLGPPYGFSIPFAVLAFVFMALHFYFVKARVP